MSFARDLGYLKEFSKETRVVTKRTSEDMVLRTKRFPLTHTHGERLISSAKSFWLEPLFFDLLKGGRTDSSFDFKDVLYLDTETTGLSRSSGTYVFLVGLGYWEESQYVLEQYFLADLAREKEMLETLLPRLQEKRVLVTYNGKSFDWPLLYNRLRLHGLHEEYSPEYHLDLLQSTRHFFKDSLGSCSLGNVERNLFRVCREDDISGEEIPSRYFQYLSEGDSDLVEPIIKHNQDDILSLTLLLKDLLLKLKGNTERVAYLYARRDHLDLAERVYEKIQEPNYEILWRLALLYKKRGAFDKAVPLWQRLLQSEYDRKALVEMAKHYEHREKDYKKAMKMVEIALDRLETRLTWQQLEDLYKRKRRIQRKLEK